MRFEIGKDIVTHVSFRGHRTRNSTVIIRMGSVALSKKAMLLGIALVVCQVFDGLLTFLGLSFLGVEMEGNGFLRELMQAYGAAPVLFAIKTGAIALIVMLTFHAHRRRWVRPLIFLLVSIYLTMAVIPWVYIISSHIAERPYSQSDNGEPS